MKILRLCTLSLEPACGRIVRCNQAVNNGTGFSKDELLGLPIFEIYHPDCREEAKKVFQSFLNSGEVQNAELKVIRKDGTVMDVCLNAKAVRDQEGNILSSRSCWTDITCQKKAEEELRDERDKGQRYLDTTSVMMIALDTQGRVTLANKRACEILGYGEAEVLGKAWFENFLPAGSSESACGMFSRVIQGDLEPVAYHEHPIVTKSGEERLIAWHNTFLRDDSGRIEGSLSSGEDITDRKKAEEALRESEEKYRLLFSNETDTVALIDATSYEIIDVNSAGQELYGYSSRGSDRHECADCERGTRGVKEGG